MICCFWWTIDSSMLTSFVCWLFSCNITICCFLVSRIVLGALCNGVRGYNIFNTFILSVFCLRFNALCNTLGNKLTLVQCLFLVSGLDLFIQHWQRSTFKNNPAKVGPATDTHQCTLHNSLANSRQGLGRWISGWLKVCWSLWPKVRKK